MSGETLLNDRYRLVAQQGSGGMAVIYKAIDQALGRTVAIKILRPSLTPDPTFITRFQNEARSIANLTHPNIVTVFDVGDDNQTHYIVMEYVDGRDLKKLIREYGALPIDRAVDLAIGICAGLGFAHRAGLVHADVKPQNILLNKDNQVKITDFGIALALSDSQPKERQSVVWGSPHYFAPEQAQGERPTAASDVYSIGVVMFEMLTGRLPFAGANQQELAMSHIRSPIPKVTDINPAVPESLSQIIYKVMSKEPSSRYRMADQLGHILVSYRDRMRQQTASDSDRVVVPPTSPSPQVSQPSIPPPNQHQPGSVAAARPEQRPKIPAPPASPKQGLPTQRYSAAPDAPSPPNYGRTAVPAPSDSRPLVPRQQPFDVKGDSRPMTPHGHPYQGMPDRYEEGEGPFKLDGVTLTLAILAFLAVACLIPLYIVVLLERT